jgi:hypothetical protein
MKSCKNCNEPISGNYCSNCGQAAQLQRIDRNYIIREIANSFNAEKGMLYTIKKMLISPGDSIRQYITEDRNRYVKPITFVIITSLIYTLVSHFFHIDAKDYQLQLSNETEPLGLPTQDLLVNWIIDYSGYSNIITGLFMALWVKLFFRKSGYNLFEIFVLFCYITGTVSICSAIVLIIQGLTHLSLIYPLSLIATIYYIWATGQFFDKTKAKSYMKATLSYVLGFLIFSISIGFVVVFIDIVLKQ